MKKTHWTIALSLIAVCISATPARANFCYCDESYEELDPAFPGMMPSEGTRSCMHMVTTAADGSVISNIRTGECVTRAWPREFSAVTACKRKFINKNPFCQS